MPDTEKIESRFKALKVPEFKSTIPKHMLTRMPESEQYLVACVSAMEQRDAWLTNVVVDGNAADIDLDIRLSKAEKFQERLTSKWSVISFISVSIVIPVLVRRLIDTFLKP